MTLIERLRACAANGSLPPATAATLEAIQTGRRFSLHSEINAALYLGVFFLLGGVSLTVKAYFQYLGHGVVIGGLALLAASLFAFCFFKRPVWDPARKVEPVSVLVDYALYAACLFLSSDVAYIEAQFHLLGKAWEWYLLAAAAFCAALAYRFDNRFVLTLALASLAGWFGIAVNNVFHAAGENLRYYAMAYGVAVLAVGALTARLNLKAHFLNTYLNIAANTLFVALVAGTMNRPVSIDGVGLMTLAIVAAIYAFHTRQFFFLLYAVVYGYIGASALLLKDVVTDAYVFVYFIFSPLVVIALLFFLSQKFRTEP